MEAIVSTGPQTTSPVGVAARMSEIRRVWGGKEFRGGVVEIVSEKRCTGEHMDDSEDVFG